MADFEGEHPYDRNDDNEAKRRNQVRHLQVPDCVSVFIFSTVL